MYKEIAIIDFGSQFTQLIARNLRELKCYSSIYQPEEFKFCDKINGIILSGSHRSKEDYKTYQKLLEEIFNLNENNNIPILGICYGKQLICNFLGAEISCGVNREYGKAEIEILNNSLIIESIEEKNFTVWMSHGDTVLSIPDNFSKIASTEDCEFAIIADDQKKIYAIQFHPEVSHSINGKKILENFIKICKLQNSWNLENFSCDEAKEVVQVVGNNDVIAAVSGGVDSTVAAKFLYNVLGDKLKCIFINNGLLRKDENFEIEKNFTKLKIPLQIVDASKEFLSNLLGVEDPERKRKIIGETFINIFEREAKKNSNIKFLLQGTLYPDVVESGHKSSNKIKSHHNVGGIPEKMNLKLIEPFKLLFKDEVREIGRLINIPDDILMRHPFPGPGLAVRIIGNVTQEKVRILQEIDHIYISNMKEMGLYDKIWQAFAVLLPVKSVGVMGDKRSYNYVCALRAVISSDGMTANAYPFESDYDDQILFLRFLNKVATIIPNKIKDVSRVTYDITSKPPATIEWE
jgi:GMP synthase (glutamine-hydrolysing)